MTSSVASSAIRNDASSGSERFGVIFDMDGVLVDSYEAHYESWRRVVEKHGLRFDREDFGRLFGKTGREIMQELWTRGPGGRGRGFDLSEGEMREIDERKEALYREIVAADFPAMPGATALIDALAAAGFALAVGSSGPPENIELTLDQLGRRARFVAVVTGRDVTRGKPDPQVFQIAASKLGLEPRRCAVIEDAPVGVLAARAAGMVAIALLSTGRSRNQFADTGRPDLFIDRLDELTPAEVRALIWANGG